jgi:hypothetical protein
VAVPLVIERPAPHTKVVSPAPFLPSTSVPLPGSVGTSASYDNIEQVWIGPLTEGSRTLLRYALPESVLPLQLEQVSLEIDIKAPGRTVVLRTYVDGVAQELAQEKSPVGTFRFQFTSADDLQLDAAGGWPLEVDVGAVAAGGAEGISAIGWQVDDMRLEIRGVTQPRTSSPE